MLTTAMLLKDDNVVNQKRDIYQASLALSGKLDGHYLTTRYANYQLDPPAAAPTGLQKRDQPFTTVTTVIEGNLYECTSFDPLLQSKFDFAN